jgi:hypothetical protein
MPSYNPKLRTALVAALTEARTFRHYAFGTLAQNATQIFKFRFCKSLHHRKFKEITNQMQQFFSLLF